MRPIYHQVEPRVKAHIFVATLALLVQRLLHQRSREANIDFSPSRAIEALSTIRLSEEKRARIRRCHRTSRLSEMPPWENNPSIGIRHNQRDPFEQYSSAYLTGIVLKRLNQFDRRYLLPTRRGELKAFTKELRNGGS